MVITFYLFPTFLLWQMDWFSETNNNQKHEETEKKVSFGYIYSQILHTYSPKMQKYGGCLWKQWLLIRIL